MILNSAVAILYLPTGSVLCFSLPFFGPRVTSIYELHYQSSLPCSFSGYSAFGKQPLSLLLCFGTALTVSTSF